MSTPHRATPEQWADQEKWASPPDSDPYALCLLELRDRIEALEATQHAHADVSRMMCSKEWKQFYAELAKPADWRPLKIETTYGSEPAADAAQILSPRMVVDGTFEHGGETYRFKANPERDDQLVPVRSADSLVERVACAMHPDSFSPGESWAAEARVAIREVAAWLRTFPEIRTTPGGVATSLDDEADR
jgi:hypothetical protein